MNLDWHKDQLDRRKLIVRGSVSGDDVLAGSLELYCIWKDGQKKRTVLVSYTSSGVGEPRISASMTAEYALHDRPGIVQWSGDWETKELVIVTNSAGEAIPLADPRLLHHLTCIYQYLRTVEAADQYTEYLLDVRDAMLPKVVGFLRRQFREWERIFSLK